MTVKTSFLPNLDVQIAAAKSVASWDDLAGQVLDNIQRAVANSLANPVGFPSLETAIIPDDKVCLALEADVPRPTEVMEAIVSYLLAHGTLARNISILVGADAGSPDKTATDLAKDSPTLQQIDIISHDPCSRQNLGYLAANAAGEPIYVNRNLIDADVVIPVCLVSGTCNWRSQVEFLFPAFSDEATISRFQQTAIEDTRADERLLLEAEEAIRWLGVYLSVQVEPGPNRSILRITSGERKNAIDLSRQQTHQSWHRKLHSACQLVVVGLSDRGRKYNWWELLTIAERYCQVLDKGGSLVIHGKLGGPAGSGKMTRSPRLSRQEKARLNDLFNKFHIYLFSDLERDKVESLGFGHIESNQEIDHLAQYAAKCLVVADADCALVSI